ncbi:hypothetical protein CSAL01_07730 [Colletotrichum salicis]|uniref:Uncharacterized protein n=1 Tax=Colletotrichum salicis TaxID=1209931 RepID=A0A135V9U7_9PEZI|nr:hypothetical protein CSAL01_07730 [Colletotrichum salicis]
MYVGLPGFRDAYFERLDGLEAASKEVFDQCLDSCEPVFQNGWKEWPRDPNEKSVLEWLADTSNPSADTASKTWMDLGRYVREEYPVHLRIPWTPRGHLAFKTLSDMENELKTALEEGLTRKTGKQDFAGLKEFQFESWRFDIRGHGAILEFDVKVGRENQFDHMKRKAKQEMRLAIQLSPESRPSFNIEIQIVTSRDSGIRQTDGGSFDW